MKNVLFFSLLVFFASHLFGQHSLEKIWQTDTTLKAPESALYDPKSEILYVSNIGDFNTPGTGFISKIGLDGKVIKLDWVTGLTQTKGLGLFKNLLYAAEQSTVAVIDVNTATVLKHIIVDSAQMLNDITIDEKGIVYVSDTKTNKVHKIENGNVSLYLDNMKSANGVLADGSNLFVLADNSLFKADANKKLTKITDGIEGGADGLVMVNSREFIATGWSGTIYYVKSDGSKQLLLDTRTEKISAADIGYNSGKKIIYVPAMSKNCLVAYTLK